MEGDFVYIDTVYPLEREGIRLHLDCMQAEEIRPQDHILLMHGSTFSSHEFDIDFQDYSLVRQLVREGYAVWRLDIAGYGQSGMVEDGLLPDTAYAAEDIRAAVERIVEISGQENIDLLGWSWGTMTAGLFAEKYPEHLDKLVLYAPILSGVGAEKTEEDFSRNTWEGSQLCIIPGGSHILLYEKNCYLAFQDSVAAFLKKP